MEMERERERVGEKGGRSHYDSSNILAAGRYSLRLVE